MPTRSRPVRSRRESATADVVESTEAKAPRKHCNTLDGKRWIQNSISVWSDIRKTPEEAKLGHPAMFPLMLVERLIETFLPVDGRVVLDPFAGSGSTVVAAERMGKQGIGLELSAEYAALAERRIREVPAAAEESSAVVRRNGQKPKTTVSATGSVIHRASALELPKLVKPNTVDLCISSPPYWNILNQRRTADLKAVRHYGNHDGDIGTIESYADFLAATTDVFRAVLDALVPGAYCCIVVMDLRKKNQFFPLHSDLATRLVEAGYLYDDLIIWNRQSEYNNLRPLGFPAVFRVNKVHEFVLLMQKPKAR